MTLAIVIGIIAVIILLVLIKNIYIVQQSRAYVVERLGAFQGVWEVGMHRSRIDLFDIDPALCDDRFLKSSDSSDRKFQMF